MSAKGTLQRFDSFAKTLDDFRVRTRSGGVVTLVAAGIIALLLVSEWIDYVTPTMQSQLIVDSERKGKIDIFFNITMPKVPCVMLSLDVMDVSGEHHDLNDLHSDIYKVRLDPSGRPVAIERGKVEGTLKEADLKKNATVGKDGKPYCGDCYGADPPPSGCCNTCKEIEEAYGRKGWSFAGADKMEQCIREGYVEKMKAQEKEGCNLHGHLSVNKVSGNFHFAPGRSFEQAGGGHIHDMASLLNRQFDFTHDIHQLQFGPAVDGMDNPLDGVRLTTLNGHSHLIQYFIKVVGAEYRYLSGNVVQTNQYSVTEHARDVSGPSGMGHAALPGIFFMYDISPMRVVQTEHRKSFTYFLTSLCAVVGGVFTVASLVDAAIYRTERALKRKMELGKLN